MPRLTLIEWVLLIVILGAIAFLAGRLYVEYFE